MKTMPTIRVSQKPHEKRFSYHGDFFTLFAHIEQAFDVCFLFEPLGEKDRFSRYAYIGFDPDHIISARGDILSVDNRRYPVPNPYTTLQQMMPQPMISRDFRGGLVGYLAYESTNYFEPAVRLSPHNDFDQFMFGVYTDGLVFDTLTGEITYFYGSRNREKKIRNALAIPLRHTSPTVTLVGNTLDAHMHADIVRKVKKRIDAGDTFQCEVGMKTEYTVKGDALPIYKKLRQINPSPFMYYLKFPKNRTLLGASPELLLSLRGKEATTRPLAGTTKRGVNPKEDQRLAKTLLTDPKEHAEHTMLVDLHRNDLGKICEFGSVDIRELMTVKKFSHVQHIASEITGRLRPDQNMFSAIAANFPMGTVSGTPKVETMRIIAANEQAPRGPYGGGIGYFGFNGDCTFALALRSLFIAGNYAFAQTSGGIVADSIPAHEYEEITRKLKAMRKVLGV